MIVAAEFGTGQVLWSVLWLALFTLWIWLFITVLSDIIRARDLSGWAKAMWAVGVIVVPIIGIVLYLIVNGDNMGHRDEDDLRAAMDAVARGREGDGARDVGADLNRLARLHETGALDDDEYERAKNRVVSS